jgi:hypothetical protein
MFPSTNPLTNADFDLIQYKFKGLIWYDSLIHDKNIESDKKLS